MSYAQRALLSKATLNVFKLGEPGGKLVYS